MSVVAPAVSPPSEEDHPQEAEEQEDEEDREAEPSGEEPKMVVIPKPIAMRVTISISSHRRDGLSFLCGIFNRGGDFGCLQGPLRHARFVCHESACRHETDEQKHTDQPKDETITKHFYLQW